MPTRSLSYVDAGGVLLGLAADRIAGDPSRWHPVAGFGRAAGALQRQLETDERRAGVYFTALSVASIVVPAIAVDRLTADRPGLRLAVSAAATWSVLGGTSLLGVAAEIRQLLTGGDLVGAKAALPSLAGRDPAPLDAEGVARAVIESVAENTSDASVGPLFWWAVAGLPGLCGYRAVNTLDAMVGHHSARYEHFGWAAARLDDLANLIPARIGGCLTAVVSGRCGAVSRIWRRDARAHPSPNAGVMESCFAGALDLRLGGPISYPYGVSDRPWLGEGELEVTAGDIARAGQLSRRVQLSAAALALGSRLLMSR